MLREENVKHFQLFNGTYTAVMYDEPVHYLKENEWIDIDNTLSKAVLIGDPLTGTVKKKTEASRKELQNDCDKEKNNETAYCVDYVENTDNDFKVQLPAKISSDAPVIVSYGGHTLRFRFENIAAVQGEASQALDENARARELQSRLNGVTDTEERTKIKNEQATAVTKSRSSISYKSIQSGLDLNYYVSGKKLKENLVLHSLPQAESFAFEFTYTGLRAVLEEDRSVTFKDEAGEAVLVVASPYMFDMEDNMSTDIAVTLEETASGCRYTLTPSRAWLEDPARAYPVTLDPTVETTQNASYVQDAGVQESEPNTNYQKINRIYVGTNWNGSASKSGRMYFNLSQWPNVAGLTSTTITNARLRLNYYPTASYQSAYKLWIDVSRVNSSWNSGSITWNSQKNMGATFISDKYLADSRKKTSGYDEFNVTAWVKARYSSPSTNYGIRLQPYNPDSNKSTNRACYISSDYSTVTLRPIMYIDYNAGIGEAPGIRNGEIYYLRNVNSGKYLDVPYASSANGTDLNQHGFNGNSNQKFKAVYNSSTRNYALVPMCATGSAVEITNTSSANDEIVQIWAKPSSGYMDSQRFNIVRNGNGSYRLLSYASGYSKAVVVQYASFDNYAAIIQHHDNGSTNGHWYFEPANKSIKTNGNTYANSGYNRQWAANYALKYGPAPNSAYKFIDLKDGGDCTNFVSQCLYAGSLPMYPEGAVWGVTDKSAATNWFYIAGVAGLDWYTISFTSATNFNKHWGQSNMRAYQTLEYASGNEALKDIDFLVWYIKNGDVIQIKNGSTLLHSMVVCNDNTTCDTKHKGQEGTCENYKKKEIIYAQHTDNFNNGHLRALLKNNNSRIVFTKIKKDI